RGSIEPVSFLDAVMMGLATDGGLLLPQTLPQPSRDTINSWQSLPYQQLAVEVLSLFIDDIDRPTLENLVERSYASFTHPQVTPIACRNNVYIMELFHGPTLAFKDIALQLLGNIFEYELTKRDSFMNIVGATSGDTGSAAIHGVRGKDRINIFILHPDGRTSPLQALQMTTVTDPNVFNIAIRGTFDDGQAIVKNIFNDLEFKDQYKLGAVNSINWARVLAQVVYYIYGYFKLKKATGADSVNFSVPTGNFGDIFAGYIAKRILPEGAINRLILATNSNDILSRFVANGDYSKGQVISTMSPSMDIQVSSNFERYLYYLRNEDGSKVKADMEQFESTGKLDLSAHIDQVRRDFISASIDERDTLATITDFYALHGYLLDPHSAVGVRAAHVLEDDPRPTICLATAHPAKFGDAVKLAIGKEPELPGPLMGLAEKESKCTVLDADTETIKSFVRKNALTTNG
ncbi:MAG: threonine synthase, partial [Desulfobulbaceae bacterium]|nr:threonine synthase [Desulfobulbaceae bacterium]